MAPEKKLEGWSEADSEAVASWRSLAVMDELFEIDEDGLRARLLRDATDRASNAPDSAINVPVHRVEVFTPRRSYLALEIARLFARTVLPCVVAMGIVAFGVYTLASGTSFGDGGAWSVLAVSAVISTLLSVIFANSGSLRRWATHVFLSS